MEKPYSYIFSNIPETIDFDFISVKNENSKTITLENISNKSILYKIENAEGFIFEPSQGIIPIKKKIELKVKINPNYATVLIANARIILDQKYTKIIRLSSIAKYPYISINKTHLDFGSVQIGHSSEQELVITNNENVPAKFTIERTSTQPGNQPCMFYISNLSGEIPPNSNYLLKILFKPLFCLNVSYETFVLSIKGGNKLSFSCRGNCHILRTWVGTKSVNFKTIPLGSQIKKLFRIYNDSDLATEFQIYHDNSGAFIFDLNEGIIPAKSNVRINVTFRPYETMVYYQRIFCLIKNHSLFPIDLFGSCHDLLIKTPLLDMKKIEFFRLKELKGIYFSDDKKKLDLYESLNAGNNNSILEEKKDAIENNKESESMKTNITTQQPQLHKEMFWEKNSNTRLISFDIDLIDFNFVEKGKVSEPHILTVNNNSNEDMIIKFIYDKPINLNNLLKSLNIFNSVNTIFFTVPEEKIIKAKTSEEFKVYFKPNKSEYYFYSDLPCQASFLSSQEKKNNKIIITKKIINGYKTKARQQLNDINKNQLSDFGKEIVNQSMVLNPLAQNKTMNQILNKSMNINKLTNNSINNDYFDPPISINISLVGHSFPPGTQIFMPMYELNPKKEIFFPPTSLNQSLYQTLKIENKNDTPLFYKIIEDPINVFRVYNKHGLIPSNSFHLICVEFTPKETTVYRFPLRIIFNHDTHDTKTVMLNGLCTDPVIDIEGVRNEMYFAPTYIGIKTKKTVKIKNLSPIDILVKIKIDKMVNGLIEVEENQFEMGTNLIKNINFYMTPEKNEEVTAHVTVTSERVHNPHLENIGIFSPMELDPNSSRDKDDFDKRIFIKEFNILGRGSDGDLEIKPEKLEFGTVKVGFHKKMFFSIYNPTITNFYIRLEPDYSGNVILPEDKDNLNSSKNNKYRSDISFDFMEGLLNSFCKKEISINFEPKTRIALSFKLNVYATDNTTKSKQIISQEKKGLNDNINSYNIDNDSMNEIGLNKEELKCTLEINAKGDYPLIKIVDVRNNVESTSKLWQDFNVDEANEELGKKLTNEEINYANSKEGKKIEEVNTKLKIVKFDFGKHYFKRDRMNVERFDIYLTLKNEGGVPTEFFFKFPDDVNIKREIWMDPVEPTSNDKVEYHVLKEHIFTLEPRKSKLDPGETTNIRLRYNIKEKGQHRLRVIFQVVNGKPLIFELFGETLGEKFGILVLPKKVIDFGKVPIGYTSYVSSPIELKNISVLKIKYMIDYSEVDKYNKLYENFHLIKLENYEGAVGPGETKYIVAYLRALSEANYKINLTLRYTDETRVFEEIITIKGIGYLPNKKIELKTKLIETGDISNEIALNKIPNKMIWNFYNKEMIQKCGFNLEELNFGEINEPKYKTVILYNYSNKYSFNFDFIEPGFLIRDELKIIPNKGVVDSGKYKIIKFVLNPLPLFNSEYEGDLLVRIAWNSEDNLLFSKSPKRKSLAPLKDVKNNQSINSPAISKVHTIQRENLYLRVIKKAKIVEKFGNLTHKETTTNNTSFIETILKDLTKQVLSSEEFNKKLTQQIPQQPLSIYKWVNNQKFPSVANVRQRYLNNLKLLIISQLGDLSTDSRSKKGRSIIELKSTHSKVNSSQINSNKQNSSGTKDLQADLPVIKEEYNENTDREIQEKYLRNLIVKYKYNVSDINERLLMINEDSKKIISDIIMENTIFNLISQSVYGEVDLTVKPRIYFFIGKESEYINGNTLGKSGDNNVINSEIKEEEKAQNTKEENKNNNNNMTESGKNEVN